MTTEVSFELNARNETAEIPFSAWTDFVVDGRRIFIRTERPEALLHALCGPGADLPEIEVTRAQAS